VEHDRVEAALAEQLTYYRRAAADFDRYAHLALIDEVASRLQGLVDLSSDVLEIACGAGHWTVRLAESARFLTAIDAAPEMLEFARQRLIGRLAGQVELVCADVFDWRPRRRYQTVFFAFWLSHVPPARFAAFWELVAACLAPDGRAAFVDDGPSEAAFEEDLEADADVPTASRRLPDGGWSRGWTPIRPAGSRGRLHQPGSEHRVVKVLHDSEGLARSLADLGWAARVEPLWETFLVGWAHPA
jgi:SAM-dependent methyltransferase